MADTRLGGVRGTGGRIIDDDQLAMDGGLFEIARDRQLRGG